MGTHWHLVMQGYESRDQTSGNLLDVVTFDFVVTEKPNSHVIAKVLEDISEMVDKHHHRIQTIVEHFDERCMTLEKVDIT